MAERETEKRRGMQARYLPSPPRKINVLVILIQGLTAVAIIIATLGTARGKEDFETPAVDEPISVSEEEWGPPNLKGGARSLQNAGGRRLQYFGSMDECIVSPLWDKEVDPSNYLFGCKEIEDMLHGRKRFLGHGQIRDVYLVEYRGLRVALKTLREAPGFSQHISRIVMHKVEAVTLDAVRGHPNIVGMLGICDTTLVTEYFPTNLDEIIWQDRETVSIRKIVSMALDAARGLQALHEASAAPVVHCDIKPQQFLMDQTGRLMLNDFNMAHFMRASASGSSCPFTASGAATRNRAWEAPEVSEGKPLTEKTDIFSMGMIFYTLISGRSPFAYTKNAAQKTARGERPGIDPSWNRNYMQVVEDMWQGEPTSRPSARQVVASLEHILDTLRL